MKKLFLIIIAFTILISCNKQKKEYYNNGNIKSKYFKKKGKLEGVYREYYNNGKLKTVHIYKNNQKVDSSIYYYTTPSEKIKRIKYWNIKGDSNIVRAVDYFKNSLRQREGKYFKGNNNKFGKWKLYHEEGWLNQIVEHFIVSDKEYLNQSWKLNEKGDTIQGNYFKLQISKDTVSVNEPIKFLFYLKKPMLSYDSDIAVCIPKGKLSDLKEDFSNINMIKLDTFPSIKNEKIIDNYKEYNLYVSFGLEFDTSGEKHLRGFIIENHKNEELDKNKDFDMLERKLYFDRVFYVK